MCEAGKEKEKKTNQRTIPLSMCLGRKREAHTSIGSRQVNIWAANYFVCVPYPLSTDQNQPTNQQQLCIDQRQASLFSHFPNLKVLSLSHKLFGGRKWLCGERATFHAAAAAAIICSVSLDITAPLPPSNHFQSLY